MLIYYVVLKLSSILIQPDKKAGVTFIHTSQSPTELVVGAHFSASEELQDALTEQALCA
jgi:hypothetical protein